METIDLEVGVWGNSTVIVIPAKTATELKLNKGDFIRVKFQKMKLVPIEEKSESPLSRKVPSNLREPLVKAYVGVRS